MTEPRRRGRPPSSAIVAKPGFQPLEPEKPVTEAPKAAVPPSARRKRGSTGGFGAKLHAPSREGYVRRFCNDVGNNLAEKMELGYTMVEEPGVQSFDPGSAINRLAGTKDGGDPLKTYLMETPVALYEQGRREMEEENAVVDQAIREGRDSAGGLTASELHPHLRSESSITIER